MAAKQPATAYDLAQARGLNAQINWIESRNNLPVCNSRPLRIGVDVSSVCNIKCIFCLADSGRKRANDEGAFADLSALATIEPVLPFLQRLIFSSYEAMLNPHFEDFINFIAKHQTSFNIFTNGLAVTPEWSEFLLAKGLGTMNLSFHGASPKVYHDIMRGSSHETVMRNLMALKHNAAKHNPAFELTLVFCAMRRNIHELEKMVHIAHHVGAKRIQVNYLLVTKPNTSYEEDSMYFHQDLYDYHVARATIEGAKIGVDVKYQPLFSEPYEKNIQTNPCYRPWEHLNITRDGGIAVCCGGGNGLGRKSDDFFSMWNSPTLQIFRKKVNSDAPPLACRKCSRGRENPKDIRNHLTYLRSMPEEQAAARIEEIERSLGKPVVIPSRALQMA